MTQALTLTPGTAVLARRGVKVQSRRGKAVVARAQKSPAPQKREAREVASVAALTAPVLAALPAHATESLFAVADLSDGVVDEESALYALVGGSLAICTAVLSLVIGSNLFIKNIVNK